MPQEVIVKQGDLFPDVITIVKDENGAIVDVTGALIKFSMRKARDPATVPLNGVAGDVMSGTAGKIRHQWAAGETDAPATYEAEFLVDPPVGDDFRVPTTGYITVIVEERVGG